MRKKCRHCIFYIPVYKIDIHESNIMYYDEPNKKITDINTYVCTTTAMPLENVLIIDDPKKRNIELNCPCYTESKLPQILAKLLRKEFFWTK